MNSASSLLTLALLLCPLPAAGADHVVMLVAAHPDDETCVGGTLGRLKELGVPVHALYVTGGEGGQQVVLTSKGPVLRPVDDDKLRRIRAAELGQAALRFGFKSYQVLGEPDTPLRLGKTGRVSRDLDRFLRSRIWDLKRLRRTIVALARRVQPTIIVTMLPRQTKIHAHHQAVGSVVLSLFLRGQLGPRARQAYGIVEVDWYPGVFAPSPRDVRWPRARRSAKLRMTYGQFSARASSAHQSQLPGHLAKIRPQTLKTVELLRPLGPQRGKEDPLRRLLAGR